MRKQDHYDFEHEYEHDYELEHEDDIPNDERLHESDYSNYTDTYEYSDEMARSAVNRFIKSESGEATGDYDNMREINLPLQDYHDEMPEPEATMRSSSTPHNKGEEEYMTRLADARKERQRRREQNPVPKPAVRVNVERPRRSHPVVVQEPLAAAAEEAEWAPMPEEDFNSFRERYSEPHVMAPREPKGERPRNAGAAKRREPDVPHEGPSPLRYMLGIILIGMLALMAILAYSNRGLRLDLVRYQALAATANDNAAEITSLGLALDASQADNAALQAKLDEMAALLEAGYPGGNDTDTPPDSPGRPGDGTPYVPATTPPPQAPAPVIHIVESGQILSRIALQHFGSSNQRYVDLIVNANDNLTNPNDIYIGQRLIIPVLD